MFNNTAWLAQVIEEIVDPDRDIVDPHHHLWPEPSMCRDQGVCRLNPYK